MEVLLSFVVLPLVVTLATLVSCGNSRPKHQPSKRTETLPISGASAEKSSEANKSGDHRDLKMQPKELHWDTSGGFRQVLISNHTKTRRAIKVKCSDNNIYRVNPVYSFIDPGQILAIDILRQNGGAKVDKMVFVAAKANKGDINPEAVFKNKAPKPMMVIPLIAVCK